MTPGEDLTGTIFVAAPTTRVTLDGDTFLIILVVSLRPLEFFVAMKRRMLGVNNQHWR